ncbi:MAG: hypothetical protein WCY08_06135 [Rhodocyclaceae bacterium]
MTTTAVFAKTELGREEVTTRSGKLTPRQRRLLIFVDGKHTVSDLRDLVAADDLSHSLGMLEEEGYIELIGFKNDSGGIDQIGETPLPSITAFRPASEVTAKQLDMAKHFMINTIKTFCGGFSHVSLQSDIFQAADAEALRAHFDLWYRAIVDSREGKRRSEELREDLLKVI